MQAHTEIPDRRRARRGTPEAGPQRPHLVAMITGMYQEMPGLSLNVPQAARLFGLNSHACRVVLDDLVNANRLYRMPDGQYKKPLQS